MRRKVAWRRKVNSSHRIVPSGHLIAQEIPSIAGTSPKASLRSDRHLILDAAKDLHEFLSTRYGAQKARL